MLQPAISVGEQVDLEDVTVMAKSRKNKSVKNQEQVMEAVPQEVHEEAAALPEEQILAAIAADAEHTTPKEIMQFEDDGGKDPAGAPPVAVLQEVPSTEWAEVQPEVVPTAIVEVVPVVTVGEPKTEPEPTFERVEVPVSDNKTVTIAGASGEVLFKPIAETKTFIQNTATPAHTTIPAEQAKPKREAPPVTAKYIVRNRSASSVLKWMGREGITAAPAKAILKRMGMDPLPSPATVQTQIQLGKSGHTNIEELGDELEDEIMSIRLELMGATSSGAPGAVVIEETVTLPVDAA